MNSTRDKRVERTQTRVIFRVPFFAPGVAKLPVVWDDSIPTACTEGERIRWNPDWFDKLKDGELVTVLCHEVCHCLLGHVWRAPDGADWDVWNQACVNGDVPILCADGTSRPARKIKTGSRLHTPFGEATVSRVVHKRAAKLVRLRFATGGSLVCTPEHPIITGEGSTRAASECCGQSVFQAVDAKGQSVPSAELVEAFCNADRGHIGAHLQDLLRAGAASGFAEVSWWKKGIGHSGPDQWVETLAAWVSGWFTRRGGHGSGSNSKESWSELLQTVYRGHNDLRVARPGAGRDGVLPDENPKQSWGSLHQSLIDELGGLFSATRGGAPLSDDQKAAVRAFAEIVPDSVASRLLGQPAWLTRIPVRPQGAPSFERQAVLGVEEFDGPADVYDFVTDLGCYVASYVLVHNCDHAVNLMLKDFSLCVAGNGLAADPFPFPEPAEAYCADSQFRGMAEEKIYGILARRPQASPGRSGASGGSGGGKGPPKPQKGQGRAGKGQGAPSPAAGSMPTFGQIAQPARGSATQGKRLQGDWAGTLIQSIKIAKGQGVLPAGMERLVEGLVHPRVPWNELLRSLLRERCCDDWDFMSPAIEYESSGFLMPSLKSEKCGLIVFVTDTSGSIDQELLAQFQSEKQECLDGMRPKRLVDIYCDAKIHKVEEYAPGETIAKECPGGGGTDFRPVFEHVGNMPEPVKCVVYLTDLFGTFPEADPGVNTIWVTWTKDQQAPFGATVYAGE